MTTDDWENAEKRAARWLLAEKRAAAGDMNCQCLLDLRRRVEALEQRATPAPEPAPAPAADRPLWRVMHEAWSATGAAASDATGYAAEIDALADWLAARDPVHRGAVFALRSEACRAREGSKP